MNDYGPNSDTMRDASPLLRFTSAMRWPRERGNLHMPDEEDTDPGAPPAGPLGALEARMARLAERFDQLEFVIVEQFEPGMTAAGELPAGNLRDRLDRIEAGLGLLRDAPDARATWSEAMASDEDLLDAAVLEARLDEIAGRLADLAHAATGAKGLPEALEARLEALEKRLEAGAEEATARHDRLLSAVAAEAEARETALRTTAAEQEARLAILKDALSAELDTRQDALLAAFVMRAETQREADAAAQDAASRLIEETAERLETRLRAALLAEMEAREAAHLAAFGPEVDALREATTAAIAARAAEHEAALAAALEAAAARHTDLRAAIAAQMESQRDTILAALERAANRPPPAPDLTHQHRSFAGFATALQTTLSQFELSVDAILDRLDGMARRLEAVETRIGTPEERWTGEGTAVPVSGLETSLGALSDGIGALVEVLGRRAGPVREPEGTLAMLDQLGALVTAAVDEASRGNQTAMDETLRDLRLAVAEIAADSLRVRVA